MLIWHDTEDAPRTPAEVFQNDKVVIWIGSYPIQSGQTISVEIFVSNNDSVEKRNDMEAEWRYNDYARNVSYWTAILDPFKVGEKVEYKIKAIGPDQIQHVQIDNFIVMDRQQLNKNMTELKRRFYATEKRLELPPIFHI